MSSDSVDRSFDFGICDISGLSLTAGSSSQTSRSLSTGHLIDRFGRAKRCWSKGSPPSQSVDGVKVFGSLPTLDLVRSVGSLLTFDGIIQNGSLADTGTFMPFGSFNPHRGISAYDSLTSLRLISLCG